MKEFDSFQLPPPHKKGVRPVQSPGPYLPGSGPKYVKSREEILGDPLTDQEVKDLVNGCIKTRRQLNMGTFLVFLFELGIVEIFGLSCSNAEL